MKRYIFFAAAFLFATVAFSQAKKPTIMVMPADVWCNEHGYMTKVDNMGSTQLVPDYINAFQTSQELNSAVAIINDLMAERGFPLKDMFQTYKIIQQQNATMNAVTSKNGNEMAESLLDQIMRTAKADIILELNWNITEQGPKKTLHYSLQGKDAYTGFSIGGTNGDSSPSFSADMQTLLHEAAIANIDNFNARLQAHFDDLFANGRAVTLNIRVFDNNEAGIDLETEFGDDELADIIDAWMAENTVQGRFSKLGSSENYVSYEQVRIPLYNNKGVAMDTEAFAKQLRNVLRKDPYNIPVKVINQGLGTCLLVLGEK